MQIASQATTGGEVDAVRPLTPGELRGLAGFEIATRLRNLRASVRGG